MLCCPPLKKSMKQGAWKLVNGYYVRFTSRRPPHYSFSEWKAYKLATYCYSCECLKKMPDRWWALQRCNNTPNLEGWTSVNISPKKECTQQLGEIRENASANLNPQGRFMVFFEHFAEECFERSLHDISPIFSWQEELEDTRDANLTSRRHQ